VHADNLKTIVFVFLSLSVADVFNTVFRQVFVNGNIDTTNTTDVSSTTQVANGSDSNPNTTDSQWYAIDDILRQRKRKGKTEFLVKWAGTDETTWVERKNLSEAALQYFYSNRPNRKRRRRHH
jgi:hypothetical protein